MAAPSDTPIKAYRGNCHCGAFVFETKLPEITTASICNCSICHKKGTVWAVTKSGNVTWVKGDLETLKSYVFGEKKFEHKFCATCGTPVAFSGYFAPPKEGEEQDVGLNVRGAPANQHARLCANCPSQDPMSSERSGTGYLGHEDLGVSALCCAAGYNSVTDITQLRRGEPRNTL